jgi:HK97 family phage major capsid protein
MLKYVEDLVTERDHLTEMAHALGEKAHEEGRQLTESEKEQVRSWQEKCRGLDEELELHGSVIDSSRSYAAIKARVQTKPADDNLPVRRNGAPPAAMSWGETFTSSEQFRSYGGAGSTGPVTMPVGLLELRQVTPAAASDPITTSALGGLVRPHVYDPLPPTLRTPLLDAVNREPVGVGSVEYFYWEPVPVPNAPEVAEGAVKPPMDATLVEKAVALRTYAWWKAVTRQALEDYARIRAIIEGRLREGLLRAIQAAIVAAITANTDIPTVTGGGSLLAAIRNGIATVDTNGYSANAVILNPADWAALDVSVMGIASIIPGIQSAFWGLTPIPSPGMTAGTAVVGDLRGGVTYFDRNATTVFVTDSHADFFLRNQLVILGETRGYPAVTEPLAMVKATAGAGGASAPASAPAPGR